MSEKRREIFEQCKNSINESTLKEFNKKTSLNSDQGYTEEEALKFMEKVLASDISNIEENLFQKNTDRYKTEKESNIK